MLAKQMRTCLFGRLVQVVAWVLLTTAWACAQDLHRPSPDDSTQERVVSPRYLLMGPDGRAVTSEDFRGRWQLIAFGYTSCPDVCPTTLLEMTHVLAALGQRAASVQPLFITVDPERDTATVLRAYCQAFDERILGLTGLPGLVQRAAENFKVRAEKIRDPSAAPGVYTVDHTAGMFLLGPDGVLTAKLGYGMPVAEVVERIQSEMKVAGK